MKTRNTIFFSALFVCMNVLPVVAFSQVVANHTVVADFDKIPQNYLDAVKKMWVIVAGESHSRGYRNGCNLLEISNPAFQVNVRESGTPEAYTDQYLRLSRATWGDLENSSGWIYDYGEEDWFTSATAIARTKAHLTYSNTHDLAIAAMGFGWCWDMTANNWPGGTIDPFYQVRWAGSTAGGPDGSKRWGLNSDDQVLTGNSVCMDTYLNATVDFINHCAASGYPTKVFFTTGPVDGNGNISENGYQRSIKHQYIRDFVGAAPGRYLFDYADILCWSDAGDEKIINWTGPGAVVHPYQVIHDDNLVDLDGTYSEDGDHIGQRGALRLAKAMWWMLARMAGWDGNTLGINQPDQKSAVQIFPNPAIDMFTVSMDAGNPGFRLTLSDINGKELLQQQIATANTEIDISNLASGIYLVSILHEKSVELRRIVKL